VELRLRLGKLETEGSKPLIEVNYANFLAKGFLKNSIFDLTHESNRDDCFHPYYLVRGKLKNHGIEINTCDVNGRRSLVFELHMNVQKKITSKPCYLLMLETPQACPENGDINQWDKYRKIFTWNEDLVDDNRFIRINFPNQIHIYPSDGFANREHFCCLIAGNKTLSVIDKRDLYMERVNAIRWFEQNAPADFDLYGADWDLPAWGRGKFGKVTRRLLRVFSHINEMHPFHCYRGKVLSKRNVMIRTRFAICYENVRDIPGYITEKIFDCFFSGCVPVYWGASNITEYIPADCFVDRRQFSDTGKVYEFLKAMTEHEFRGYQQRIALFLQSKAAYPFSSEFFAETIVNTIVQDLGPKS
jgi:hypothetical protein